MKVSILLIMVSVLVGCASVSPYNQGCRDGIQSYNTLGDSKDLNKFCDDLESANKAKAENVREHQK